MKYGHYIYKDIQIVERKPNGDVIIDFDVYKKRFVGDTIGIYQEYKQITVHTKVPETFIVKDNEKKEDRFPYSWYANQVGIELFYIYHRTDVRRVWAITGRNYGKDWTYGLYKMVRQTNARIPYHFVSGQKVLQNAKAGYSDQYKETLSDLIRLQEQYPEKLPEELRKTKFDQLWYESNFQTYPKVVFNKDNTKDDKKWLTDIIAGFDDPNRVKSRKPSDGAVGQIQINEFFPEVDDSDYDSSVFLSRISSIRSTFERTPLKYGLPLTKEIFLSNNAQPNDEKYCDEVDIQYPYYVYEVLVKTLGFDTMSTSWVDYEVDVAGVREKQCVMRGNAYRNPIVRGEYREQQERATKENLSIPETARTQEQQEQLYKMIGSPYIPTRKDQSKKTYDKIKNYLIDNNGKGKTITPAFEKELETNWKLLHVAYSADTDFSEEVILFERRLYMNPLWKQQKTLKYVSVCWDKLHIPLSKNKDVLYAQNLQKIITKDQIALECFQWMVNNKKTQNHIVAFDDDELFYRDEFRKFNKRLLINGYKIMNVDPSGAPKLGKWKIVFRVQSYTRSIMSGFNLYTSRCGKVLEDLADCKNNKLGKRDEDRGRNKLNWINADEYGFYYHERYQNLNY